MSGLLAVLLALQPGAEAEPHALAGLLEGRWDNAAQAAASESRPRVHVRHEALTLADMAGAALYMEMRVGGPDADVYRQRVFVIGAAPDDAALSMAVYELAAPDRFAGADAAALAALTEDDLVRFDPGCDVVWRKTEEGWSGAMEDGSCVRTSSRTGRDLVVTAAFTVAADRFTHAEAGRWADDGAVVFGPENGVPNLYDRAD